MARVRRCDRCGKYYEPYENRNNAIGTVTFNINEEDVSGEEYKDLCPDCMEDFTAWYKSVQVPSILKRAVVAQCLGKPTVEE